MRPPASPLSRLTDVAALGPDALRRVAGVVPRTTALLDAAERLLVRLDSVMAQLEQTVGHLDRVVDRAGSTEVAARTVVVGLDETHRRAADLLDGYEPVLQGSAATAARLGERFGPAQVDALVAYLDFLPMLQALDREAVPLLATLQTVAPDLTELLAVSRGLNELMGSLPGLGRAKKRVDEELDSRD